MDYNLYSIFDAATSTFGVPLAQENDATAMRAFAHECMKKESLWNSHPTDFVLYQVGVFESNSGDIQTCPPKIICRATDFVLKGDK